MGIRVRVLGVGPCCLVGFLVMAESELQQGEACYYKKDHVDVDVDVDDKTAFHSDKDLSYIVRFFLVFRVLIMIFFVTG